MVILAIWLIVEVLLIGLFPITYVTAAIGLLILLLALAPSVRTFYDQGAYRLSIVCSQEGGKHGTLDTVSGDPLHTSWH